MKKGKLIKSKIFISTLAILTLAIFFFPLKSYSFVDENMIFYDYCSEKIKNGEFGLSGEELVKFIEDRSNNSKREAYLYGLLVTQLELSLCSAVKLNEFKEGSPVVGKDSIMNVVEDTKPFLEKAFELFNLNVQLALAIKLRDNPDPLKYFGDQQLAPGYAPVREYNQSSDNLIEEAINNIPNLEKGVKELIKRVNGYLNMPGVSREEMDRAYENLLDGLKNKCSKLVSFDQDLSRISKDEEIDIKLAWEEIDKSEREGKLLAYVNQDIPTRDKKMNASNNIKKSYQQIRDSTEKKKRQAMRGVMFLNVPINYYGENLRLYQIIEKKYRYSRDVGTLLNPVGAVMFKLQEEIKGDIKETVGNIKSSNDLLPFPGKGFLRVVLRERLGDYFADYEQEEKEILKEIGG